MERSSRPRGDQKHQHQRSQQQNKQAQGFTNRQMEKCYDCGKKGHNTRDCWYKKVEGSVATSTKKRKMKKKLGILRPLMQLKKLINKMSLSPVTLTNKSRLHLQV
ncbi:hypothetical protein H5410_021276 [Solanum commersonii]|uniref:CCHC-type domain-containing protein n=1 Tax=Solanum commersonii TaxID=4109 RepID=A0A9J5ZAI5_SOLCO|nr:hypothetical protein H5410_021276 [Solanum commersonii]